MSSNKGSQKTKARRATSNELIQAITTAVKQRGRGGQSTSQWLHNGVASAFKMNGNSGAKQEMRTYVAPLAKSLQIQGRTPKYTNVAGGICIEHTEPLPVQNGANHVIVNSDTFKWLSPMAAGFEEYRVQYEIGWVPTCPATTSGRVMLAFDYDPSDNSGYGITQADDYLNTADHCVSAIWSPCVITPKQSAWLKTGVTGDARLYSPGIIHFAVDNVTLGLVLVRYRVELRKPQPNATQTYLQRGAYSIYTGVFAGTTATSGSTPFTIENNLMTQRSPGKYQVSWSTDGTITSISDGGTVNNTLFTTASNSNKVIVWYTSGPGDTIEFVPTPFPEGATSYKMEIVPVIENAVYGLA